MHGVLGCLHFSAILQVLLDGRAVRRVVNFIGNRVLCVVMQMLQDLHGVLLQLLHVEGRCTLSTHLRQQQQRQQWWQQWHALTERLLQLWC
jgi:hypothetical protein